MLPWANSSTVLVTAGDLKQALVVVSSAAAKNRDTPPYLQGIMCDSGVSELQLFGSDGKRLVRARLKSSRGTPRVILLPITYLDLLLHPLNQVAPSLPVTVQLSADKAHFHADVLNVDVPLSKPKELSQLRASYQHILQEQAPPVILSAQRTELLPPVTVLSRSATSDAYGQIRLTLTVEDSDLALRVNDKVERVPIQRAGTASAVTINAQLLREALEAIPVDDGRIHIGIDGPMKPLRIEGDQYTYLLLPIVGK